MSVQEGEREREEGEFFSREGLEKIKMGGGGQGRGNSNIFISVHYHNNSCRHLTVKSNADDKNSRQIGRGKRRDTKPHPCDNPLSMEDYIFSFAYQALLLYLVHSRTE